MISRLRCWWVKLAMSIGSWRLRPEGAAIWDGGDPVALTGEVVWWWCTRAGHALAPVGQLTAKAAGA